jgi:hypothetical protein
LSLLNAINISSLESLSASFVRIWKISAKISAKIFCTRFPVLDQFGQSISSSGPEHKGITICCLKHTSRLIKVYMYKRMYHMSQQTTDYGRPVRKSPSLNCRKSNPNPKFIGTAKAYFVCHIGPKFQISLIYAFIGCP